MEYVGRSSCTCTENIGMECDDIMVVKAGRGKNQSYRVVWTPAHDNTRFMHGQLNEQTSGFWKDRSYA